MSRGWERPGEKPPILNLSTALFKETNAGDVFYQKRDLVASSRESNKAEILEIYLLCMLLGFRGGKKKEEERKEIIRRTISQLGSESVPQELRVNKDHLREPSGNDTLYRTAKLAGLIAVVLFGLLYIVARVQQSSSLDRLPLPVIASPILK